ncbi:MAG: phosphoserine phosphatase SerB [Kangiellaceae bacterium]|nr:phosphoserine phosphatase SerB [Kangiellaceae bacterium]
MIQNQLNNTFHLQRDCVSASDSLPDVPKVLSVFTPKLKKDDSRPDFIQFLTAGSALQGELWIIFRETESLLIWDIYLRENKEALVNLVARSDLFDSLLWPELQQAPELLVFDMDSTFIEIEVIDELAHRHGVGEQVSAVTESAMRGELDFAESLISRVACLKDLSESTISDICKSLPLSKGAAELVVRCHNNDVKVAIVSGGFTPFVGFLKESMGLYEVEANKLEAIDGKLTGRVEGQIVDALAKADFVERLSKELGLSTEKIMAIGDGANDLKMMEKTGFSLAYRAKPAVQKAAGGQMNISNLNHLADIFGW